MGRLDDPGTESRTKRKREAFETFVGRILRGGVVSSISLLVVGVVWNWRATGQTSFDYRIEHMNLYEFLIGEVREIASGAFGPRLFVSLGIVALLLTPYLRVLASILFFGFVERDPKYTIFTTFVFAVLTYSLLLR